MALEVGLMNILIGLGLAPGAADGLGKEVGEGLAPLADKIGSDFSDRIGKGFSKAGSTLTKTITAPLLAAGGVVLNSAMKQDEAFDLLRSATGATGEEFEGLKDTFLDVAKNVAVPYEAIAPVIAELNQRLGLTGEPLNNLATQLLDLQQITGQAVDAEGIAKLFQAFQVPAEQQGALLDTIFRASQQTGIAFDQLVSQVASGAANFQEFGFSAEEAVGFLGSLEQGGIDSSAVLAGLRKGLVASLKGNEDIQKIEEKRAKSLKTIETATGDLEVAEQKLAELRSNPKTAQSAILAQENTVKRLSDTIAEESKLVEGYNKAIADGAAAAGVSTEQFFDQTVADVERLIAAGDEAAAKNLVGEVFGTKNIAPVLSAIERGTLNYEDFTKGLVEGGDTISGVADETADFSEQFQQFRNQLDNDLGAIGQEIFPVISEAIKDFTPILGDLIKELGLLAKDFVPVVKDALDTALPIIKDLVTRFQDLSPETKKVVTQFVVFAGVLGPILGPLGKLVGAFGGLFKLFKVFPFSALGNPWVLGILAIAGLAFLIIKNWDSIKEFFVRLFEEIGKAATAVWEAIKGAAKAAADAVVAVFYYLGAAFVAIWNGLVAIVKGIWDAIVLIVEGAIAAVIGILYVLGAGFVAIWEGIKAGAQFLVDAVVALFGFLRDGLFAIWDAIRAAGQAVWDGITAAARAVVDFITAYYEGLFTFFFGLWDRIKGLASGAFSGIGEIAGAVVGVVTGYYSGLFGFFRTLWGNIRDTAANAINGVLKIFTNVRDRIKAIIDTILSLPGKVFNAFGDFGKRIFGARADGGPVSGGNPYIVGERGPELFTPRTSGTVISNEQLAGVLSGAGRGNNDTYNITITNPVPEPASVTIPQALRRTSYLRSR